jgi:hypothetical protein
MKILVLKTVKADMTAYEGFKYPVSGIVTLPPGEWNPKPECGGGLHGLKWGSGDGSLLNWDVGAKWLVLEVDADKCVDIGGKVKFEGGEVVFCGDRKGATDYVYERAPNGALVVGAIRSVGNSESVSTGYRGSSISGNDGSSVSGYWGSSTSGDGGSSVSGYWGSSTSGDRGSSLSGHRGTSTSGDGGSSISGYYGTSISGHRGTSTSGYGGSASAGEGGTIQIKHSDGERYRLITGYIGENGLKANVKYRLDKEGKFVEVT